MFKSQLNPIIIDSRFFETFKKILEIILLILGFFDEEGNITDSKIDEMLTMTKGFLADYPELKKDVVKASSLCEMAQNIKPIKTDSIILPHYGKPRDYNA